MIRLLSSLLFCSLALFAQAQDKQKQQFVLDSNSLSTSSHQVQIEGKTIKYTAKAGYLSLETEYGEKEAHVFFVAYTLDGVKDIAKRPLTFSFNGGPGSSSVWLHLGVLGPRRIAMGEEGEPLPPPFSLIDNDYSWLDLTDMVFIDPVTTGYSRADEPDKAKKYHGFDGDIASVAEFIRRYTAQEERWASPKYIIGESYGTTRASALSSYLIDNYGYYLNGVMLVSSIMEFQTARFQPGNDLPYMLFLPTYAATAHYHKKLEAKYQNMPLPDYLKLVEDFVLNEYAGALFKGNRLSEEEQKALAKKIAAFTGLSPLYVERAHLRPVIYSFTKELLRDSSLVVGRFDSRYKYHDERNPNAESGELDPSYQPTILGVFSHGINDYLSRELKFKSKLPYNILTGRVHPWDYSRFTNSYVNTAESLRRAMAMNPNMRVWISNGYYDLATPYFATEHTINHLNIAPELRKNIWMTYYPAGHMMYLQKKSLVQMREEAKLFYAGKMGE